MADLTLRDVPRDLHRWLKRQAEAHHRSLNKEAIALLEASRKNEPATAPRPNAEELMAIGRRCAALPELDPRSADDIIGYDENGLPA